MVNNVKNYLKNPDISRGLENPRTRNKSAFKIKKVSYKCPTSQPFYPWTTIYDIVV